MSIWSRTKPKEIDLVLSSSGVRAPCFVGAIEALEKKNYKICRIAGSSGGAIVAAGYALGYTLDEMKKISRQTPYEAFRDFKVNNLLTMSNPSVYTGRALDSFYQSIFQDACMKDMKIECKIAVVTILEGKRVLISPETHPDLPVWKAVRMSSTIPFIFPYYELDGEPVTDGGLVTSMFDIFPDKTRPMVGLRPRADYGFRKTMQENKASKLFIWNYLKILIEYFMDAVDNQHIPQVEWDKTIVIPTYEVGSFNFYLTEEDVEHLIQYGHEAVTSSPLLPAN